MLHLIVRLIARYALWIYIACGLGMIAYLRVALTARREGMYEIFSLEQIDAAKRVYRASGMILVLLFIVVGVYALSHYVELPDASTTLSMPTASSKEETPTPRPSPSPTSTPPTAPAIATPRPRLTASRTPTATTPQPLPTGAESAACPHPNVQLIQPGRNHVINVGIQVKGTAQRENFDRYEFKFQSRDFEDEWHWVETFTKPVEGGDLGFWSTAHLPPGNYRFMLIAIDKMGNSEECIVQVIIQH